MRTPTKPSPQTKAKVATPIPTKKEKEKKKGRGIEEGRGKGEDKKKVDKEWVVENICIRPDPCGGGGGGSGRRRAAVGAHSRPTTHRHILCAYSAINDPLTQAQLQFQLFFS